MTTRRECVRCARLPVDRWHSKWLASYARRVSAAGFAEAKGDSGHPPREVGGDPFSDMSERLQNAGAVSEGADVRPVWVYGRKGSRVRFLAPGRLQPAFLGPPERRTLRTTGNRCSDRLLRAACALQTCHKWSEGRAARRRGDHTAAQAHSRSSDPKGSGGAPCHAWRFGSAPYRCGTAGSVISEVLRDAGTRRR